MAKGKQEKAEQGLDEAAGAEGVTKPREWVGGVGSFLFGFVVGYILIMVARQSVYALVALILGTLGGTSLIRYFRAGLNPGWLGVGLFVGFVTNLIVGYILFGSVILYDPGRGQTGTY